MNMNKIKLLGCLLIIMASLCLTKVYAATDCKTNACIECVYKYKNKSIIYRFYSNGKKVSHELISDRTWGSSYEDHYEILSGDIHDEDFVDDNNKFTCSKELFYEETTVDTPKDGPNHQIRVYSTNGITRKELTFSISQNANGLQVYDEEEPDETKYVPNVDLENICQNDGVRKSMKIIGYVVLVSKYLVPILIIVFGVLDFFKAITSNDENAINKASKSLLKRVIAGFAVFLAPSIVYGLLNITGVVGDELDGNNTQFGNCTKCIFKVNECPESSESDDDNKKDQSKKQKKNDDDSTKKDEKNDNNNDGNKEKGKRSTR